MTLVLAANLLLAAVAALLPNDVLRWHSWAIYGAQAVTLLPYALRRAYYARNLFLPTLFVLAYFLVVLTFGAWLVPRSYGFDKQYASVALSIETYRVMVPYFVLANVVLFVIACRTLGAVARARPPQTTPGGGAAAPEPTFGLGFEAVCFAAFALVSVADVYSLFSFQLAIAIVHLSDVSRRRAVRRFVAYAAYLAVMVAFNSENKREIAMMLFLIVFLETFYSASRLRLTPKSILAYVGSAAGFLLLVLTASIRRGYGGFDVTSAVDAALAIPRYVGSDIFIDGLTDNLELNYAYGAAVTSIDLTVRGEIPYQMGASIWKVLLLPVSRDLFPDKPESVMLLFTRVYSPAMWVNDGSLPVMSSSEMFVNYGVFGLAPFAMIWMAVDWCYVRLYRSRPATFAFYSCTFATVTVLMFARGSGLEQYVLYYLIGAPTLLGGAALARASRRRSARGPRPAPAPPTLSQPRWS